MNNLLMYQIPPEKSRIIKSIALQHGFRIRVVQPEEAGASVGALAELPGAAQAGKGSAVSFEDEMLVLCNVPRDAFHSFLAQLRARNVPVTLKAVVTEHNASWSFARLHENLVEEHAAFLMICVVSGKFGSSGSKKAVHIAPLYPAHGR